MTREEGHQRLATQHDQRRGLERLHRHHPTSAAREEPNLAKELSRLPERVGDLGAVVAVGRILQLPRDDDVDRIRRLADVEDVLATDRPPDRCRTGKRLQLRGRQVAEQRGTEEGDDPVDGDIRHGPQHTSVRRGPS